MTLTVCVRLINFWPPKEDRSYFVCVYEKKKKKKNPLLTLKKLSGGGGGVPIKIQCFFFSLRVSAVLAGDAPMEGGLGGSPPPLPL